MCCAHTPRVVLCAKHQNVSLVSGSVLGAGLLMALLSGSLVFCAYQSVCFLTLVSCCHAAGLAPARTLTLCPPALQYIACMSVLMLAELVLGIVYLIPSTRKEIVDAMKDETGKTISNDTVVIAGYVLLGAVVVKVRVDCSCRAWSSPVLTRAFAVRLGGVCGLPSQGGWPRARG